MLLPLHKRMRSFQRRTYYKKISRHFVPSSLRLFVYRTQRMLLFYFPIANYNLHLLGKTLYMPTVKEKNQLFFIYLDSQKNFARGRLTKMIQSLYLSPTISTHVDVKINAVQTQVKVRVFKEGLSPSPSTIILHLNLRGMIFFYCFNYQVMFCISVILPCVLCGNI